MTEHPFAHELRTERNADLDAEIAQDYYCSCDLEPTEDEEASNKCACCGKALE